MATRRMNRTKDFKRRNSEDLSDLGEEDSNQLNYIPNRIETEENNIYSSGNDSDNLKTEQNEEKMNVKEQILKR